MSDPRPSLREHRGLLGQLRRQWPWVVCVLVVALGLVLIVLDAWRRGSTVIGAAVLLAGLFRLVFRDPGILAIRSQAFDSILYLGLGLAIVVLAIVVPPVFG
jgi:membrane-bound ClpP family serine protease